MSREVQARFCERLGVRFPGATRLVVGFQHKRDAERFLNAVKERFGGFGLDLHPDKTRLIEFGRFASERRRERGQGKPETFDFLGFTHYCAETGQGRFQLGRKPEAKRMARTLKLLKEGSTQADASQSCGHGKMAGKGGRRMAEPCLSGCHRHPPDMGA